MSDTGGTPSKGQKAGHRRQLRERKQRKLYVDEYALGDEELEGTRGFSVAEKLESAKFAQSGMVRELKGSDLTISFLQQYGFNIPLLFREKTGLGLKMPDPNEFTVNDVRLCVGSRRLLDVMDVNTQKNLQMTMKEWQQYYDNPKRDRLLNVISLEFSHTRLDNYVQSPEIVRKIDWVDVVWPKKLKDAQKEGTNLIGEMMYPKVQKYCLMSVKNCYTDFHIDFGGTSVWYHILKGSKVFWLIPPTEKNLQLYEKWVLSGKQSDTFFGDTVERCARVYLTAGNTFFIPTGWIHAVYTPSDSLVFGGNFLHSFGIVKQLKSAQVEDNTKVPQKFRYPFFTEMLWYVLARYVHVLLGHSHLEGEVSLSEEEIALKPHVHLTHHELFGLKEIVMYLYDLPAQKKNVPELVIDPVALIKDVRTLVERHCKDVQEMAITGVPILQILGSITPKFQVYDRVRVKQEIKQEIARKNAEIIREQQAMDAAAAAAAAAAANTTTSPIKVSVINFNPTVLTAANCIHKVENGSVIEIKKEPLENGIKQEPDKSEKTVATTASFVSPADTFKYRPPKKVHLANAIGATHNFNNTVSVITAAPSSQNIHLNNQTSVITSNTHQNCSTPISIVSSSSSSSSVAPASPSSTTNMSTATSTSTLSSFSGSQTQDSEVFNASSGCETKLSPNVTGTGQPRRRRTRCKNCAACQRSDCGECSFCLDMVKFGGPGRAKQTCMMRQCLSPMLPVTAQCVFCHLDGWRQTPVSPQTKQTATMEGPSALMECSVCYEIAHPDCALSQLDGTEDAAEAKGVVNEDLPNSWECPNCCRSGKNNDYKPRHFRARQKSSEVRRVSVGGANLNHCDSEPTSTPMPFQTQEFVFTSESEMETATNHWKIGYKRHHPDNKAERSDDSNSPDGSPTMLSDKKKRRNSDDGISVTSSMPDSLDANVSMDCNVSTNSNGHSQSSGEKGGRKKSTIRSQLAQQMLNSSSRVLKKPQFPVRPVSQGHGSSSSMQAMMPTINYTMDPTLMKIIFRYLPPETLVTCCLVCKVWSNVAVDPDLWKVMNCSEHKLSASLLTAIVRRQPEHLILDWTQIAKRQVAWIIARLPALKHLSLQNCPIQAVLGLHTCLCPPLQILDLSFVRGLNDAAIREILSAPKDSRPGLSDSKTRLKDLKTLKLGGTDISDVALRYITQALPNLVHLDVSSCQRITDAGVAQIGTSPTAIANLVELNLSSCRLITEPSLDHLAKCEKLIWLDLRHVPLVSTQAVIKFAAKSKHDLCVKDVKLVERRKLTPPQTSI